MEIPTAFSEVLQVSWMLCLGGGTCAGLICVLWGPILIVNSPALDNAWLWLRGLDKAVFPDW